MGASILCSLSKGGWLYTYGWRRASRGQQGSPSPLPPPRPLLIYFEQHSCQSQTLLPLQEKERKEPSVANFFCGLGCCFFFHPPPFHVVAEKRGKEAFSFPFLVPFYSPPLSLTVALWSSDFYAARLLPRPKCDLEFGKQGRGEGGWREQKANRDRERRGGGSERRANQVLQPPQKTLEGQKNDERRRDLKWIKDPAPVPIICPGLQQN